MNSAALFPSPILTSEGVDFFKKEKGLNEFSVVVPLPDGPPCGGPIARVVDSISAGRKTADLYKRRIIRLGLLSAAAMQVMKVGGFLFEHGVAFYAYVQYAPKTLWGQYFYANAAHEAAKRILSTTLFGCSVSSVMTSVLAVVAGVIISKGVAAIYNLFVDRDKKIFISLVDMISDIFSFVFHGI
ncbi:MAG: hypothetical protein H0W50_07615 [Parachlamydiaceae bacterium]|nr:hypothetical protein [Parachlamydiaceae bacterium]